MSGPATQTASLEEALRELVIVLKAVHLYPLGHPARRQAITSACAKLSQALADRDHLDFAIRKDHFTFQEQPLAPQHPALKKLARQLFERRVERLSVLPDLSHRDLEEWACLIALEPEDILRRGGLPKLMQAAAITTLWVNESDFARILSMRREQAEQPPPALAPEESETPPAVGQSKAEELMENLAAALFTDPEASLPQEPGPEELLARMEEQAGDENFRLLLRELVDLLWKFDREGEFPRLLTCLLTLGRHCREPRLSETRRDACRRAVQDLVDEDLTHRLAHYMCDPDTSHQDSSQAQNLLLLLGESAAEVLADHLAEETESHARKILAQALARFAGAALPAMNRLLRDERWFVVRNALAILGEIRDPSQVAHLAVFLGHDDVRVRREAIRALTRIGTADAMDVLLVAVEEGDGDLQRQALLFLGALKQRAALPHLLRFATLRDPLLRRAELTRGAVRALGEIGAEEAVPALISLLKRRKRLRRGRYQDIQEEAALALARIGTVQALEALETVMEQGSGRLAQTAARALQERIQTSDHGY
ncbi:HEAT repeat domain-containing protein [Geoalkalibacter halelectricus]|uniref:HEAT repeat domain-containing protein n=1 Tax=Geoalkalibacter halelectricus TaxID=2847045 RepID=A0ABY5ZQ59_9BACT|nr:HEAT repeat domain-containing protein [Geoalkalibacter halelectricus]MDO3377409.1 HEAT repeat domain-containing protein [Geoalkalibacter halelectricus]UWZ80831.1 HEAT repeat domain-containing protein [Geoalkalibacter halelectricus]